MTDQQFSLGRYNMQRWALFAPTYTNWEVCISQSAFAYNIESIRTGGVRIKMQHGTQHLC